MVYGRVEVSLFKFGILLLSIGGLASSAAANSPFWRQKDKVYRRIENREVLVSVISEDKDSGGSHITIRGGGQVARDCQMVWRRSKDYAEVARASDYVTKAEYNADSKLLSVRIEAFGRSANIKLEMSPQDSPPRLGFKVVDGPMIGMHGYYDFYDAKSKKCDVGIDAEYSYDKFPLPRFFLEFALEVMFQKMAVQLRKYVEEGPSAKD